VYSRFVSDDCPVQQVAFPFLRSRKRQRRRRVRENRQPDRIREHRRNYTERGRRVPAPAELVHGIRSRKNTFRPKDRFVQMQLSE